MRLSYSSMDTYKQCPLKYKYKEIDRKKEPTSKEAVFGTVMHATLKFIHTPQGALYPPLEEALDYFSKNWNSDVFPSEQEERAAFSQGVTMIQDYYAKNDIPAAKIVDLESYFSIEIGPEDNRHTISGIIDRIDRTEDGFEIIDYKTSKKMPSQDFIDNNLQLSVYLLAFLKRYPKLPQEDAHDLQNITVSLYFLKHGVKLSATRTKEQLEQVEQEFLDVITQIQEQQFEPIVTPLCDWCGFQKICPMWRHKFKEERHIDTEEVNATIEEYLAVKARMTSDKTKLAELQSKVMDYMDQEEVERVFSDSGVIARTERKTYQYDEEKLRALLEPKGLWDDAVKVDGVALNRIAKGLPTPDRNVIDGAKEVKSSSQSLTVKKK